ncbi:hypothetical protein Q7P37_009681 [Cladosporium fusiforme]
MADAENDFPQFNDGDVLIIITPSRRYKLHSAVLRRSSPTLATILDEEAAVELSKNARRKGVTTRFRLHLINNENAGVRQGGVEAPSHVLRRIPLDESGTPAGQYPQLLGDANENGRVVEQFVLAWEQVLGAFYNRGIDIGDNEHDGLEYLLESAGTVLAVAEYLHNPGIVTRPIEATLLSLGQVLQRSIATNPAPWLDFTFRLRSKSLWKEALIHGTGRFNSPPIRDALSTHDLHPSIAQILSKKAALLKSLSQRTQNQLLSYYPEALQRTKTVGRADRDSIGRASYANDIMQWLGLTVWRHWIAQQADRASGEAYLDRNQLRQFHEYFPMSLKGESVMENRISELKADGQGMVRKVLENCSYLDTEKFKPGHMTCTWVGPDDYPWEQQAAASGEEMSERGGTVEPSEFGGSMDVDGHSVAGTMM